MYASDCRKTVLLFCDAKILSSLHYCVLGFRERERCCLSARDPDRDLEQKRTFSQRILLLLKRGMGLNPRCITCRYRGRKTRPACKHKRFFRSVTQLMHFELQRQETTSSSSRRVIKFSSRREGIFASSSLPPLLPSSFHPCFLPLPPDSLTH